MYTVILLDAIKFPDSCFLNAIFMSLQMSATRQSQACYHRREANYISKQSSRQQTCNIKMHA